MGRNQWRIQINGSRWSREEVGREEIETKYELRQIVKSFKVRKYTAFYSVIYMKIRKQKAPYKTNISNCWYIFTFYNMNEDIHTAL